MKQARVEVEISTSDFCEMLTDAIRARGINIDPVQRNLIEVKRTEGDPNDQKEAGSWWTIKVRGIAWSELPVQQVKEVE